MNDIEKIQLSKMIQANNTEDQTDLIRKLKHGSKIRQDVIILKELKEKYSRLAKTNKSQFEQMAINRANFLFNNYTDIFNKILKDELDINLLGKFIYILLKIENGDIDQHEASYEVGKILKEMYIDSALKKSEKIDKQHQNKKIVSKPVKKISWKEYKEKKENN